MSGWTQRMRKLVKASSTKFTPHDCRRTFRSGLTRLGVDGDIAEMMLNHVREELLETYDHEPRAADRAAAAKRWADHLAGIVNNAANDEQVVDLAA